MPDILNVHNFTQPDFKKIVLLQKEHNLKIKLNCKKLLKFKNKTLKY